MFRSRPNILPEQQVCELQDQQAEWETVTTNADYGSHYLPAIQRVPLTCRRYTPPHIRMGTGLEPPWDVTMTGLRCMYERRVPLNRQADFHRVHFPTKAGKRLLTEVCHGDPEHAPSTHYHRPIAYEERPFFHGADYPRDSCMFLHQGLGNNTNRRLYTSCRAPRSFQVAPGCTF